MASRAPPRTMPRSSATPRSIWPTAPRTKSKPRFHNASRWAPTTSARSRKRPDARRMNSRPSLPQAAHYIRQASEQMQGVADTVRQRDVRELVGEVQDFARRQPTLFFGGAVVLGFAALRFLKSTAPKPATVKPIERVRTAPRRVAIMALSTTSMRSPGCSAMPSSSWASSCRMKCSWRGLSCRRK